MRRLSSISIASVVMISASCLMPSAAETPWKGVNEKKWAELIQSDINSQASAETICTNSTNFATTSKEAAFKVWAHSIAQKYCTEEKEGVEGLEKAKAAAPIANKEDHADSTAPRSTKSALGRRFTNMTRGAGQHSIEC